MIMLRVNLEDMEVLFIFILYVIGRGVVGFVGWLCVKVVFWEEGIVWRVIVIEMMGEVYCVYLLFVCCVVNFWFEVCFYWLFLVV